MRNTVHDCLVDLFGGKAPTEEMVSMALFFLPKDILRLCEQWGANDTEVREATFRWLKKELESTYKGG